MYVDSIKNIGYMDSLFQELPEVMIIDALQAAMEGFEVVTMEEACLMSLLVLLAVILWISTCIRE